MSRLRLAGALWLLLALVAGVGPLLVADPTAPTAAPLAPPSWAHPLGTTGMGQDALSWLVCGAGPTVALGVAAGLLVTALGAAVGALGGFFGGRLDDALDLLANVFLVLPGLPLMVILAAWAPPGPPAMIAAIVLTGWAWHARAIRARVASLRRREHVEASLLLGEHPLRVLGVEVLPHLRGQLGASAIGATAQAIAASVGLEYLGLGDLRAVTWGTSLYWAGNDAALITGSWWLFVPTGLAIAVTCASLVLVQTALDDQANPAAGGDPLGSTPFVPDA